MKQIGAFLCGALAAATTLTAGEAKVTADAGKPGIRVSPLLYGVFFEAINRADDGGIYAEKIQNRSFEDKDLALAWTLDMDRNSDGSMTLDTSKPLNAANPTSLRLEVKRGSAAAVNHGFRAFSARPETRNQLAVEKGKAYDLSFYARGAMPLTVRLEKADGTAVASARVQSEGTDWKRFRISLTPSESVPDAQLALHAEAAGTVWLDMVSLFPAGELFRADLLAKLREMGPAFVRFPGGCYVEGKTLTDAFRWKQTLGDIAERPGHWNLWGYRSTDGLGYHEYLLLCEALKAEPLFVANCGMSHEEQKHTKFPPAGVLDEYVQDALDAIEYANGDAATTRWGSARAKAGHPAPFNLKLMEIGNENGGPVYHAAYAKMYDAIKAKYPQMQLIANKWGGIPTNRPVELVDEHYYRAPFDFLQQANQYDTYERGKSRVYVGEYAVTKQCGRGSMRAALGEAVFMTGLERNSDVVAMASYAPLFEFIGWKRWNPNAILFDASRSYGTPSWLNQVLFARNRADRILPSTVEAPAAPDFFQPRKVTNAPALFTVAGLDDKDGSIILKLVNLAGEPMKVALTLNGLRSLKPTARLTTLAAGNLDDENDFDLPTRVAPETREIPASAPSMTVELPKFSVNVLRLARE